MENVYAVASPSSSTLYGNIGSAIKELIISKFPYEYFKYINVSSELAFRNVSRNLRYNTTNEMTKRLKPFLIIKPTYSVGNTDLFLNDIPLTKNFDNIEYGVDKRSLFPVINDPDNRYMIKYKMNRDKIDFDVTVTVQSLHSQLDLYKAMVNQFVWERPYIHRVGLESMLPRSMMSYISKLLGYDIDANSARIPSFLRYLKKVSQFPITYKMRNASATDEFFMYYNHDIIVNFTDLSIDEGTKKNMSDDSYNITFHVTAEFNLPGLFVLTGNNSTLHDMKIDFVIGNDTNSIKEYIPLCTFNNFYNKYPSTLDGFKLYTTSIFNVEPDKITKNDYLDITELFDQEVLQVIKENVDLNSSIDALLKIIIVKDNVELTYTTDWTVDYNKMQVTLIKPDKYSTYRIIIYFNSLKINDRLIELFEDEQSNTIHDNSSIIQDSTVSKNLVQTKTITPATSSQVITPDTGYTLQAVIVKGLDETYSLLSSKFTLGQDESGNTTLTYNGDTNPTYTINTDGKLVLTFSATN